MARDAIDVFRSGSGTRLGDQPFVVGLALVLCLLYLYFFAFRAIVQFELNYDFSQPSLFKVYWAGEGEDYSENRMNQVLVTDYRTQYRMFLSSLGDIERLRIDPIEFQGTVRLGSMIISELGYQTESLESPSDLQRIEPRQQALPVDVDGDGVLITTAGRDGQFELKISSVRTGLFPIIHIINVVLIFCLVVVSGKSLGFLFERDRYVPCCFLVVLLLAIAMAGVTGINVHPDESAHYAAVKYYSQHLLPPPIDSALAAGSFSVYGYSRLANLEAYYPLAGYFTWLLNPINLPPVFDSRVFGLLLLATLTLLTILNRNFRVFAVPLLISAQTWYLFSYANSEGFAIFLATLVSYQVADNSSRLNVLLMSPNHERNWIWLTLYGLLFGILLLSKTNFYFFVLFVGIYLLWKMIKGDFADQRLLWLRLGTIAAIAVSVYGGRVAVDYGVNGPDTGARVAAAIEKNAQFEYKPSTPLNQKNIYLYLKDRGFSLDRIIHKEQWLEKTLYSGFGAYGFTQHFGSQSYYELVSYAGMAMLALIIFGSLIFGPPPTQSLLIIVTVCAVALIGMLLWRSWTISFQPQGRYLAPILPMLGILYYHVRPYIYDRGIMALTVAMFLLGVYSFIFIGLHDIWKSPLYS
jgi:hypothetical protein